MIDWARCSNAGHLGRTFEGSISPFYLGSLPGLQALPEPVPLMEALMLTVARVREQSRNGRIRP